MIRLANHATGGNDHALTQSRMARNALAYRKVQSEHLMEMGKIIAARDTFKRESNGQA